jgi:hypothetical protein
MSIPLRSGRYSRWRPFGWEPPIETCSRDEAEPDDPSTGRRCPVLQQEVQVDALNRRFKNDVAEFLRSTAILDHSDAPGKTPPPQGVVELDLEPFEGAAKVGDFARSGQGSTSRIKTYWLPWKSGGTSSIQLGGEADYFFTSQLAGCQIRIVPGPYQGPILRRTTNCNVRGAPGVRNRSSTSPAP